VSVFLGVDGGGTKTHAVVADGAGTPLGVGVSGASNWEDVGLDGAVATVGAAVEEAFRQANLGPSDATAAVFGLAGLDWESDRQRLAIVPESLGLTCEWLTVNDSFVALRAGANHPWGIVVIAGTGAVAAGRHPEGQEFRTLGLGPIYGDYGSASEIGEAAMRAVAEWFIGLGGATALTEALCLHAGVDTPQELLERFSRSQEPLDPIARVVMKVADEGDPTAKSIAERAGTGLGARAALVARKLSMQQLPVEVVLAGGVFRSANRALMSAFEMELRRTVPRAAVARLEVPPVVGAVLRAMELAGMEPPGAVHLHLSLEVIKHLGYEFA
jgi:N-acetylglucosamine kinase-like BadF-type ATPase